MAIFFRKHMFKTPRIKLASLGLLMAGAQASGSNYQKITGEDVFDEAAKFVYESDDTTTTGIGFKITVPKDECTGVLSEVFPTNKVTQNDTFVKTDRVITMEWESEPDGLWPGESWNNSTPLDLLKIEDCSLLNATIAFTSHAEGFTAEYGSKLSAKYVAPQASLHNFQELGLYNRNSVLLEGAVNFDSGSDTANITVKYSSNDDTTTGVGFAVKFSNTACTLSEVFDVDDHAIAAGIESTDADETSLAFGWASLDGSFPGSTEKDLATITFNNTGGDCQPYIKFTSSAAGYEERNLNEKPLTVEIDNINENSGKNQVIATVTGGTSGATYSLSADVDSPLSIDANSGQVSLDPNPNFEAKSAYTFEIEDNDGRTSGEITAYIINLDEIAPTISSDAAATATFKASAEGLRVVYTAAADDSWDISGGVTFSLSSEVSGLEINSASGEVSLDWVTAGKLATYTFSVKATDAAEMSSEQFVTLTINATGCMNKRAYNYNPLATGAGTCDMPTGTAAEKKRKRGKNFANTQLGKVNDMLVVGATVDSIMTDFETWVGSAGTNSKPNFGSIMNKLDRRGVEDAALTDDDKKARASLLRAGMAETKEAGKDAMIVPVANDKLLPKRFKAKLEAANIANLELKYGKERNTIAVEAIEDSTSGAEICGNADIRLDLLSEAVEVILETQGSVSLKCSDADTPVSILELVDDPDATDGLLNYTYKCWDGSAWGNEQSVAQYQSFECNDIETFVLSDTGTPPDEYNCDSKEQYWLEQGCACGGGDGDASVTGTAAWCTVLQTEWQNNCGAAQCSA